MRTKSKTFLDIALMRSRMYEATTIMRIVMKTFSASTLTTSLIKSLRKKSLRKSLRKSLWRSLMN